MRCGRLSGMATPRVPDRQDSPGETVSQLTPVPAMPRSGLRGTMSERCVPCPGREGSGAGSARRAGTGSGWLEKAEDQKSWFLAQFLVVLGIAFAHCFGWDRLDEFFDEESGIGGSRAQS